jgi:hypothetical protein
VFSAREAGRRRGRPLGRRRRQRPWRRRRLAPIAARSALLEGGDRGGGRPSLLERIRDAETGTPLFQEDLVTQDSIDAIAAAIARAPAAPADTPRAPLPDFPPTDGAAYKVFALPFESPNDGDRTLETNAADPAASPFGWRYAIA